MRQENWQQDLNKLLNDKKETDFNWGTWDCGLFMAAIVKAVRNEEKDYAEPFRGKYKTALGSLRALRKAGYNDLRDYLIHCFGEPIDAAHAWRGDLALYEDCGGVNVGPYSILLGYQPLGDRVPTVRRFVNIPRMDVQEYFRIR